MPRASVAALTIPARARARRSLDSWRAVRQARRFVRACRTPVRVCWDLDNTLVGSGLLIRAGSRLEDAIVEAEPVPNMLDLHAAIRQRFPAAGQFVVSARAGSMRGATLAWLRRHGLALDPAAVCLIPYPQAKSRIWAELARGGRLLIVDDLSYDHESETPSVYADLVATARRTATAYIGLEEISAITADPRSVDAVASRAADALEPRGSGVS